MIYYLFLPFFSLALVVFQTSLLEVIFFNKIGIEISLLFVIYAGLNMDVLKGCLLSFMLGFVMDCLTVPVSGLYTLIYVLIFFFTMQLAPRVYKSKISFIMSFSLLCAFLEMFLLVLIYEIIYGSNVFTDGLAIYIPQAVLISLLSPAFFTLCYRIEEWIDGGHARTA